MTGLGVEKAGSISRSLILDWVCSFYEMTIFSTTIEVGSPKRGGVLSMDRAWKSQGLDDIALSIFLSTYKK